MPNIKKGEGGHVLLLEVVLARTASLAAWERALVVSLASMDTGVPSEMARGRESTLACLAHVFLLRTVRSDLRVRWAT